MGAKCEAFIGDPIDRIVCAPYLTAYNTSIYVATGASQDQMILDADYYVKFLNSYGNDACKIQSSYRTLCSFFFIKCVNINVTLGQPPNDTLPTATTNVTVAFPQFTCRESCQKSMDLCSVTPDLYNCADNTTTSLGSRPLYPPELSIELFNLTSLNYSHYQYDQGTNQSIWSYIYDQLYCFNSTDLSLNINETIDTSVCQSPLVYRKSPDRWYDENIAGYTWVTATSDCLVPCPAPAFSMDQWNSFYHLVDTLSMMSALSALFMIITYGILNREHTNYEKILLFQFTSLFIRSLSGVVMVFSGGTKNNVCPDPGRSMTSLDTLCVVYGVLFYGFSLNAIMWWSFLVFDLWCVVRKYKQPPLQQFRQLKLLYFLIGSTIITIVMTVFATIKGKYIADKGNVVCWISDNDYVDELFWGPVGALIGVCSILIVWIIVDVYRLINRTNVGWQLGKKFVYAQIGPLGYIIVFYVAYVYIFVYNRTYHLSYLELKKKSAVAYFDCILNSQAGGYDPNTCLVAGPEIAAYTIFITLLQIFGMFTLFYAFNSKFVAIWKETLLKLRAWFYYRVLGKKVQLDYNPSTAINTATTATKLSSVGSTDGMSSLSISPPIASASQKKSKKNRQSKLILSPTFDQLPPMNDNDNNNNNNNNVDIQLETFNNHSDNNNNNVDIQLETLNNQQSESNNINSNDNNQNVGNSESNNNGGEIATFESKE
ncbi:G-protein-coupled receptor family protein [Cavenderia fasciculata]|uniref:G-protein-coupled receptor family protein n=1 Tax=Cavenderia fasciculata TaxID=261658 RepID=F4Q2G5_CACFS|nr:G-protein-coupled receptor family protein [Cavenderia fasciculata]EGG16644.1 G-protein-coupled receptor family protein [Cavenderia fasciculata]|eukprot:XP_004355118.1 G-protein-coupled receptor family protein [Cavenderia fasciculata]